MRRPLVISCMSPENTPFERTRFFFFLNCHATQLNHFISLCLTMDEVKKIWNSFILSQ